jgi:hypothetical protein
MVESAARAAACAWIVDAGRRTAKRHSAGGTGRFGGWRSGGARRGQAVAGVAESAIYYARLRSGVAERSSGAARSACSL